MTFNADHLGARVVAGVRVREEVDLLVVRVAELLERLLADAGPGGGAAEQPDDRGALRAAETGVAPGDHVGRDPALPVRRPGQRHEAPLAGHEILDLDGIADGEDVRVARAHLVVDADAAAFADREAGRLGQRRVGPHAEREDHDVGRIRLAGLRLHLERAAVELLESGHAVAERQLHAMPLQVPLDEAGELRVERSQDLIEHLDERHLEPGMDQVLRRLEADEAAADHHRPPRRLDELDARVVVHPGQEGRCPVRSTRGSPARPARSAPGRSPADRCRAAADGPTARPATAPACRRTRSSPRRSRRCAGPRSSASARWRSPRSWSARRSRTCARKSCSLATRRLDSFGITPETWYGSPQFAYETYGPRSTMRISAFSSSLRRRAAHDAPPATPPTMMTFMLALLPFPFMTGFHYVQG